MPATRLLRQDDAEELAALLVENREHLAPWEPLREDSFFTVAEQAAVLEAALVAHAAGLLLPLAVLDADGRLAGRITLNGIVRGAFQSASLGYWVAQDRTGSGLGTAAVGEILDLAFGDLGLHRVQADVLLHNVASQRVLAKHGFRQFGIAPTYLKIAGRWQDCVLYQRLADD